MRIPLSLLWSQGLSIVFQNGTEINHFYFRTLMTCPFSFSTKILYHVKENHFYGICITFVISDIVIPSFSSLSTV